MARYMGEMPSSSSFPSRRRVYLDHAATTPMAPAAAAALAEGAARWANPSSVHAEGRAARAVLEEARGRIAAALGWSGDVVLTGGATEALGLALRATQGAVLVSAIEHSAVLGHAPDAERVAVDGAGRLDLDALAQALARSGQGPLVAVMHANNETGVIQPVAEALALVRAAGGRLLVDCAQTAGKRPLPEADMLVVAGHKLGGPPGVGALLVCDPSALAPFPAGGQERGLRPGTENLPAVLAFAAALDALDPGVWEARRAMREALEARLAAAGAIIAGAGVERLATIGSIRMAGVEGMTQLMAFDLDGFAVSAGSACSSGKVKASHVLGAMGWDMRAAGECVRVSLGPGTTAKEVEAFAQAWERLAARLGPARAAA
jgi:cysteine desulfurase